MDIVAIRELQQQFNELMFERAGQLDRCHHCQKSGDVIGEQESVDKVKHLGIRAVAAQMRIGESMAV